MNGPFDTLIGILHCDLGGSTTLLFALARPAECVGI